MSESLQSFEDKLKAAACSSNPAMSGYVDAEQIRGYLTTGMAKVTALGFDIKFTDEEIIQAMLACARRYNSIPPYVNGADPTRLPNHDNTFFDGIAAELYAIEYRRLSEKDREYNAGGVSTNLVAARLKHVQLLMKDHYDKFTEAAGTRKRIRNIQRAYRRY